MSADAVQNSVSDNSPNATKRLTIWFLTITFALVAGFATPLLFLSKQGSDPGSVEASAKVIPVSHRDEVGYIDLPEIVAVWLRPVSVGICGLICRYKSIKKIVYKLKS